VTKEQAIALARARLALKKQQQVTPEQSQEPQRPQVQYSQEPYVEPEMADPLMVSEAGIQDSPEARRAAIRNVLQGATFGTADEAEAALRSAFGDQTYAENIDLIRQEMSQFAQENPGQATTQELVGAAVSPASLLKAPKYIEQLAPMARGAIKGGTGGFIYGAGSAEGGLGERLEEGGVSAGVGIFIGAPLEKAASLLGNARLNRTIKRQNTAPSLDNLREAKNAAYQAVDEAQFAIGPGEAQEIVKRASKVAADEQYITTPGTTTAVDKAQRLLTSLTTKGMSLGQSEAVRRRLFKLADDPNEGYIVRRMIDEYDDVIENSLARSNIPQLQIARDLNSKFRKVETLEDLFKKADMKTGTTVDNYRKVAQKLLDNPRQLKYFNADERAAIEALAKGTASQQTLNLIGKLTPSPTAFNLAVNGVALAFNPWLLTLYLGTGGARLAADSKIVRQARDLIAKAGGINKVKEASQNPNAGSLTVGGVSADQIREAFLLNEDQQ
jgi:phosphoglycolate phosphatase-like HAD superfamily hydrolase